VFLEVPGGFSGFRAFHRVLKRPEWGRQRVPSAVSRSVGKSHSPLLCGGGIGGGVGGKFPEFQKWDALYIQDRMQIRIPGGTVTRYVQALAMCRHSHPAPLQYFSTIQSFSSGWGSVLPSGTYRACLRQFVYCRVFVQQFVL